jgi:hypothetical protein
MTGEKLKGRKNYPHKPIKTPEEIRCKSVKESKIFKKDGKKILNMPFSHEQLIEFYKENSWILSLTKNSIYHYEMLIALQQQIVCLEAKIKILERKIDGK